MRKIIIKLPDKKVDKYRLQRRGWSGRRYTTAVGLLGGLSRAFPKGFLKEKTAIVVKEGLFPRGHYKGIVVNESMPSDRPTYLLYCAALFMEDEISKFILNRIERRYIKAL